MSDLEKLKYVTRRKFFQQCGTGMGALALTSLLNEKLFAAPREAAGSMPPATHFAPESQKHHLPFPIGRAVAPRLV